MLYIYTFPKKNVVYIHINKTFQYIYLKKYIDITTKDKILEQLKHNFLKMIINYIHII